MHTEGTFKAITEWPGKVLEIIARRKSSTSAQSEAELQKGSADKMMEYEVFSLCYTLTNSNMGTDTNVRANITSHCHSTEYSSAGKVKH